MVQQPLLCAFVASQAKNVRMLESTPILWCVPASAQLSWQKNAKVRDENSVFEHLLKTAFHKPAGRCIVGFSTSGMLAVLVAHFGAFLPAGMCRCLATRKFECFLGGWPSSFCHVCFYPNGIAFLMLAGKNSQILQISAPENWLKILNQLIYLRLCKVHHSSIKHNWLITCRIWRFFVSWKVKLEISGVSNNLTQPQSALPMGEQHEWVRKVNIHVLGSKFLSLLVCYTEPVRNYQSRVRHKNRHLDVFTGEKDAGRGNRNFSLALEQANQYHMR